MYIVYIIIYGESSYIMVIFWYYKNISTLCQSTRKIDILVDKMQYFFTFNL